MKIDSEKCGRNGEELMEPGNILQIIMIVTGFFLLLVTIGSLAHRRMTESFCLAWGLIALILVLAGIFLRPSQLAKYISTMGLLMVVAIGFCVVYMAYFISVKISELSRQNRELAIQVSLLRQENERIMEQMVAMADQQRQGGEGLMMKKDKDLLIIVPAYNEAKNIPVVLDQLEEPEIAKIADILIIDDASSDGTGQLTKERGHMVVTHVYNLGYGCGLQLGYKYAVMRDYKYVIQMDADGQHDVCNVLKLYKQLKTPDQEGRCPDIVLGSRFLEDSTPFPVSPIKKLAFVLFRLLIRLGTGRKIMDPTTGLQGLSRRVSRFYSIYGNFDDRYPDANMLLQMLMLDFRVEEIPAVMYTRKEGISMHSGLKPVFYMFRMMFSIIAVWIRVKIYKVGKGIVEDEEAA